MTDQIDKDDLRDLRAVVEDVVMRLKSLNERGYQVGFNMNVPAGTVDNFTVHRLTAVNMNDA